MEMTTEDKMKKMNQDNAGKRWVIFKRLRKESLRLKFLGSPFKWKKPSMQLGFVYNLLFKIVSVFEAVVLVSTLCCFFLCCGCHF